MIARVDINRIKYASLQSYSNPVKNYLGIISIQVSLVDIKLCSFYEF